MELQSASSSQPHSVTESKNPGHSPSDTDPSNATLTSDHNDDILVGCSHIDHFLLDPAGKNQIIQKYKTVVTWGATRRNRDAPPAAKRRKMQAPCCGTCNSALHRPFPCLHCSFLGCLAHIPGHLQVATHRFGVDVVSGSLFCSECDDFVHNVTLESVYMASQLVIEERRNKSRESKLIREAFRPWSPDDKDSALLKTAKAVACRGRRGLLNLGSTCYLNVILQTLIHNPLLRNYFLSDRHNSRLCKTKDCMCCEMDKLFSEIYSTNSSPHGPISILHSTWQASSDLAGYSQQDAHEFFISALNQIHTNSKGSTNVSCNCIIHSTFAGQLQSDVKCGKCGQVRPTVDPMLDISLELRGLNHGDDSQSGVFTLDDCLRRFTRTEKLGSKEYSCETCGTSSHEATKRLSIRKLPPVLCFQLKRFEHKNSAQKIEIPIRFPASLNMSPYTTLAATAGAGKVLGPEISYEYDLFAVVNHDGQMDTGHYTNFARFQDEWYRFDDEKVSHTTLRECLASNAYMCAYVKRHLDYKPNQRPSYVVSREAEAIKEREREKEKREKEIDEGLALLL